MIHTPSPKPNERVERPRRSVFMRVLGSTWISPFLGIAAFLSILYYKNKRAQEMKKPEVAQTDVDHRVPVIAPSGLLGRAREDGPVLTLGFFRTGDLLLRRYHANLEVAVVWLDQKRAFVRSEEGKRVELLHWLKAGGGRFALYRLPQQSPKVRQALAVQLKKGFPGESKGRVLSSILALYRRAGVILPTALVATRHSSAQQQLAQIVRKSHYNDLK